MRVFAAVLALTFTASAEVRVAQMPRKVATLDNSVLSRYLSELGITNFQRDHGGVFINVKDDKGNDKIVDLAWSDSDTLVMRAAWNSPHKELGDMPILNAWNQKFRFCKVSTQNTPESKDGNTLVIMHLDQFMPVRAGEDAVKDVVRRSYELFKTSVLGFDKFFTDVYKQAHDRQRERDGN